MVDIEFFLVQDVLSSVVIVSPNRSDVDDEYVSDSSSFVMSEKVVASFVVFPFSSDLDHGQLFRFNFFN